MMFRHLIEENKDVGEDLKNEKVSLQFIEALMDPSIPLPNDLVYNFYHNLSLLRIYFVPAEKKGIFEKGYLLLTA